MLTTGLPVCPERVGRFTGVIGTDSTGEKSEALYEGDIVDFLGITGEIIFECGAFGIGFRNQIDWDMVQAEIPKITGCRNRLLACQCDNFISLWEIIWNFNIEEDNCGDLIKVIGNTYEKSKGENE